MTIASMLANAMIIAGVGILIYSLSPASRIIEELPEGNLRRRWSILRGLIAFFILGYLGFLTLLPTIESTPALTVSSIFLGGACFVLLVCLLMAQTLRDVKRIATLEYENIRDPLMGLFNRRYFDQRLQQEVARARRYALPLSLMMVDVDHFKRVNDTHGHQAGDEVLRSLGVLLQGRTRETDIVARYGGEEVAVLLPNTAVENARLLAERLRAAIEQNSVTSPAGRPLQCTASFGLTGYTTEGFDAPEMVRRADAALYRAKNDGRNRVAEYAAVLPAEPVAS